MVDFLVVGSGASGGYLAFELAKGGASVVLLEAGQAFESKDFPTNSLDGAAQMFWGAGLELSDDGRLSFARGKCLGGSTVVGQAVLDRFDEDAFGEWRIRSGVPFFDVELMEPHYDAVESALSIQTIPKAHRNTNAEVFCHGLTANGRRWKAVRRAQGDCHGQGGSDCMACVWGCPRGSKQSALVTTIRWAQQRGVDVQCGFEVDRIHVSPFHVDVSGVQSGGPKTIRAAKVVLAAGSFGNTAILLKSNIASKLPALGKGFCCHPKFLAFGAFDAPVDAHKGAFESVCAQDGTLRKLGFTFESIYGPPSWVASWMPGVGGDHLGLMNRYRHWASMAAVIRDEPTGVLGIDTKGRFVVQKRLTEVDEWRVGEAVREMREMLELSGAQTVKMSPQGVGHHLMGGCAMGTDIKTSVVDPDFQVHGYSSVLIADSSVFPSAPGINPLLTIMALSHRASQIMLQP